MDENWMQPTFFCSKMKTFLSVDIISYLPNIPWRNVDLFCPNIECRHNNYANDEKSSLWTNQFQQHSMRLSMVLHFFENFTYVMIFLNYNRIYAVSTNFPLTKIWCILKDVENKKYGKSGSYQQLSSNLGIFVFPLLAKWCFQNMWRETYAPVASKTSSIYESGVVITSN